MNEAPEAHFDSPVNDFEEQIQEVRFMYRKRYTKWYLETAEGRPGRMIEVGSPIFTRVEGRTIIDVCSHN